MTSASCLPLSLVPPFPPFPLISQLLSLPLPISPLLVPSARVIYLSPARKIACRGLRFPSRLPLCLCLFFFNSKDFIDKVPTLSSSSCLSPPLLLPSISLFLSWIFPPLPPSLPRRLSFLHSLPLLLASDRCKNRTGEALSPLPACQLINIFMRGVINYT